MSRPFSYNDENFTVIGNVLFLHFMMINAIDRDGNIVEIPPEIYKRMLYKSNYLLYVKIKDNLTVANMCAVGTRKSLSDEKYYIYSQSGIGTTGAYLVGYYILRDI